MTSRDVKLSKDPSASMMHKSLSQIPDAQPLFCIETKEKVSKQTLYVNVFLTKSVEPPLDKEFDEVELVNSYASGENAPQYNIMASCGPLAWSKPINNKRHYTTNVLINKDFGIRKVLQSLVVRDYTIGVIFSILDSKYNDPNYQKVQFIGHKFDADFQHYKVLDGQKTVEMSDDLVINKVSIMPESVSTNKSYAEKDKIMDCDSKESSFGETTHQEQSKFDKKEDLPYDLHYRPTTNVLTCTVQAEKLPESLSFNDDHIVIILKGQKPINVYIPLQIDLEVPVKYRYYPSQMIFRAVFKIKDYTC